PRVETDHYVAAAVAQVEGVGVALRAEADDADGLAADQVEVRVILVEDFCHSGLLLVRQSYAAPYPTPQRENWGTPPTPGLPALKIGRLAARRRGTSGSRGKGNLWRCGSARGTRASPRAEGGVSRVRGRLGDHVGSQPS